MSAFDCLKLSIYLSRFFSKSFAGYRRGTYLLGGSKNDPEVTLLQPLVFSSEHLILYSKDISEIFWWHIDLYCNRSKCELFTYSWWLFITGNALKLIRTETYDIIFEFRNSWRTGICKGLNRIQILSSLKWKAIDSDSVSGSITKPSILIYNKIPRSLCISIELWDNKDDTDRQWARLERTDVIQSLWNNV